MKLKQISLVALLIGVLLIARVIVPFVALEAFAAQKSSIGIIGGADGPTAIFLTSRIMNGWPFFAILLGSALIISALFCLIFSKTVKNNCSVKTTALSIGLSALSAIVLVCFFMVFTSETLSDPSRHPVASAVSVLLGMFSFFAIIILSTVYIKDRIKKWSVAGFIIDILTGFIYLPAFIFGIDCLYKIIT